MPIPRQIKRVRYVLCITLSMPLISSLNFSSLLVLLFWPLKVFLRRHIFFCEGSWHKWLFIFSPLLLLSSQISFQILCLAMLCCAQKHIICHLMWLIQPKCDAERLRNLSAGCTYSTIKISMGQRSSLPFEFHFVWSRGRFDVNWAPVEIKYSFGMSYG